MNTWIQILSVSAIIGTALVGGIFFAFSTFIMKALAKIAPAEGIRAMQSINIVVLNPLFLSFFFGTALITAGLAIFALIGTSGSGLPHWLFVGSINYIAGTFLVTAFGNVPLNNRLAAASPDDREGHALWRHYLDRWSLLNHVRTAAALLAAFCFIMGLIQN